MIELPDLETLRRQIGQEIAVSDWITISQDRIDAFAEATDDRQWIHVDAARAAVPDVANGFTIREFRLDDEPPSEDIAATANGTRRRPRAENATMNETR